MGVKIDAEAEGASINIVISDEAGDICGLVGDRHKRQRHMHRYDIHIGLWSDGPEFRISVLARRKTLTVVSNCQTRGLCCYPRALPTRNSLNFLHGSARRTVSDEGQELLVSIPSCHLSPIH